MSIVDLAVKMGAWDVELDQSIVEDGNKYVSPGHKMEEILDRL